MSLTDTQEVGANRRKTAGQSVCARCNWWRAETPSPRPRNKDELGLHWGLWGDKTGLRQVSCKEVKSVACVWDYTGILKGHTGGQRCMERSISREPQIPVGPWVSIIIKNPELSFTDSMSVAKFIVPSTRLWENEDKLLTLAGCLHIPGK